MVWNIPWIGSTSELHLGGMGTAVNKNFIDSLITHVTSKKKLVFPLLFRIVMDALPVQAYDI
jgi:hypothetical protein